MAVAMTSLYTGNPARSDTSMTGELTLTGLVLPIGGVKEKVLAARRAGMKRVILPKANQKDLREVPESVRKEMEFVFAELRRLGARNIVLSSNLRLRQDGFPISGQSQPADPSIAGWLRTSQDRLWTGEIR